MKMTKSDLSDCCKPLLSHLQMQRVYEYPPLKALKQDNLILNWYRSNTSVLLQLTRIPCTKEKTIPHNFLQGNNFLQGFHIQNFIFTSIHQKILLQIRIFCLMSMRCQTQIKISTTTSARLSQVIPKYYF